LIFVTQNAPNNSSYNFPFYNKQVLRPCLLLIDLRYKSENLTRRAELLKIVASNFSLDGENLLPVWKKPFLYVVKNTKRSKWLGILGSIRNPPVINPSEASGLWLAEG